MFLFLIFTDVKCGLLRHWSIVDVLTAELCILMLLMHRYKLGYMQNMSVFASEAL